MRTVCLVAVMALATSCAGINAHRLVPRGIEKDDRMIEAVRTLIPEGTPIAEAQRLMESAGFTCSLLENTSFVIEKDWEQYWYQDSVEYAEARASRSPDLKDRTGLNYLECKRHESAGFMMYRDWTVAMVHRDGKVIEVLARADLDGL